MRVAIFGLVLAFSVTAASAQQPMQQQAPVERVPADQPASAAQVTDTPAAPTAANTITRNVRLVVLDTVVIDRKGNPVTDLKKDDFQIIENDVPQDVRFFEAPGKYTPSPDITIDSTADLDRLAPRAPVNIICLDEFNTLFEDMAFARYSLKKWLEKQPDKLSTPTMLVAVNLQTFTVLRDYTQNKQAILDALDHHFAAYPWQAHNFAWVGERRATAFLTLRRVAEASVGHDGHKNMIWIGRGFPTSFRARATSDEESHVNSAIERTINQLRDARVTLYTIDPAGVQIDPYKYGEAAGLFSPFGGDPDFKQLARATGGRNFFGRNDVDAEVGSSIRDSASLYTLVYRPMEGNSPHNEYHQIKVSVTRPGLTVVTREGYFPDRRPAKIAGDGTVHKKLAQELISAGDSNMVYDAVRFTVAPSAKAPDTYNVIVAPESLVWKNAKDGQPRSATVIVMVTTFDKKGKELKREGKTITAQAPPDVAPTGPLMRPVGMPYKIEPDPKAVRARFVVRVEATGHMGTVDVTYGSNAIVQAAPAPPPPANPATSPTPATTPPTL